MNFKKLAVAFTAAGAVLLAAGCSSKTAPQPTYATTQTASSTSGKDVNSCKAKAKTTTTTTTSSTSTGASN